MCGKARALDGALGPATRCCVTLARSLLSLVAIYVQTEEVGGSDLWWFGPRYPGLEAWYIKKAPVNRGLRVSQGVIRVHLLEAKELVQKDNFLGLGGKSDPYAKVSIGLQHCRSRTVYKNLNPTWNEVFEVRFSSTSFRSPGVCRLHSGLRRAQCLSWLLREAMVRVKVVLMGK